MRISLCVNASGLTRDATISLAGGDSAFARSFTRALHFDPGDGHEIASVTVLTDPEGASVEAVEQAAVSTATDTSLSAFLHLLSKAAEGSDALLLVPGDGPLWDPALARRLIDVHKRYVAEYTFADGYPEGVAPELVSPEILPALVELTQRHPEVTARHTLFEIVQKDINAFDVETELSSEDMRMLRIRLRCDARPNRLLCDRVVASLEQSGRDDPNPEAERVIKIVTRQPHHLRTLPTFLTLQVITDSSQHPFYLPPSPPFAKEQRTMSAADVRRIIRSFHALSPTGTIHLSTWGEIALHEEVEEILSISKEVDGADFLVETSGVGWNPGIVDTVVNREFPGIIWIVTLDAYREEVYRRVRGEGFHEAVDFAKRLLERFPDRVYLQSTRINENEEDLESFYREWKKVTPNVVIQKYDHFSGRLPDRRVVDNAPVVRLPCWHLKRDISVLVDGTVPLCREDLDIEHRLGNALTEDLEEIWERGAPLYQQHIRKEYPRLCTACDEYYTFNF